MEKIQGIMGRLNYTARTCDDLSQKEAEQRRADGLNSVAGDRNQDDGYDCDICKNKGFVAKIVQGKDGEWSLTTVDCKCADVRRSIMRMKKSGLKNIIKDYTFEKFDASERWQQTIKDAAIEYAKNPEGWFFIGGQSGAGKTHICTAICREFLLHGRRVAYMLWRDDVVKIKGAVNDSEQYSKLIDSYKKAEVLYMDDLFKTGKAPDGSKQVPTGADVNVAFEILNYRYNNPELLTIISSECTANDLLSIDEATGGRILERAKVFSLKPDMSRNYRLRGMVEL